MHPPSLSDPFRSFGAIEFVAREEVLALQSYATAAAGTDICQHSMLSCISTGSCLSIQSGIPPQQTEPTQIA